MCCCYFYSRCGGLVSFWGRLMEHLFWHTESTGFNFLHIQVLQRVIPTCSPREPWPAPLSLMDPQSAGSYTSGQWKWEGGREGQDPGSPGASRQWAALLYGGGLHCCLFIDYSIYIAHVSQTQRSLHKQANHKKPILKKYCSMRQHLKLEVGEFIYFADLVLSKVSSAECSVVCFYSNLH